MVFRNNRVKLATLGTFGIVGLSFLFFQFSSETVSSDQCRETTKKNIVLSPFDSLVINFDHQVLSGVDSGFIPGIAYCIIKDDSIVAMNAIGTRNVETNDTINENTVFRLASVSKGFASFLTALYVQDSILSFEDKVVKYLPGLTLKDSANTADLEIFHLLNHTSGLVPHAYDDLVESNVDINEIMDNLPFVDICCKAGGVYGYQNVVYSLCGIILETIERKPYHTLLNERVFKPLNMHHASADFESIVNSTNVAHPHALNEDGWKRLELINTYYSVAPAAGVNASISDMAIWLKTLLGGTSTIMDTSTMHYLYKPHIYTPLKRAYTQNWKNISGRFYGLGWRIYQVGEKQVVYHGGYVRGYRADIAFCPEENVGIVVLMNGASAFGGKLVPSFYNNYFALRNTK